MTTTLLTAAEAAERAGIAPATLYLAVKAGVIEPVDWARPWKFATDVIDNYAHDRLERETKSKQILVRLSNDQLETVRRNARAWRDEYPDERAGASDADYIRALIIADDIARGIV